MADYSVGDLVKWDTWSFKGVGIVVGVNLGTKNSIYKDGWINVYWVKSNYGIGLDSIYKPNNLTIISSFPLDNA